MPTRRRKSLRERIPLPITAIAAIVAAGAWLLGWWIVPLAAVAGGVAWWQREDIGEQAMWGAVAGWVILLLIDSLHGRTYALASALGGAMFVPGPLSLLATLVFAGALAWSAAILAAAATKLAKRERK